MPKHTACEHAHSLPALPSPTGAHDCTQMYAHARTTTRTPQASLFRSHALLLATRPTPVPPLARSYAYGPQQAPWAHAHAVATRARELVRALAMFPRAAAACDEPQKRRRVAELCPIIPKAARLRVALVACASLARARSELGDTCGALAARAGNRQRTTRDAPWLHPLGSAVWHAAIASSVHRRRLGEWG